MPVTAKGQSNELEQPLVQLPKCITQFLASLLEIWHVLSGWESRRHAEYLTDTAVCAWLGPRHAVHVKALLVIDEFLFACAFYAGLIGESLTAIEHDTVQVLRAFTKVPSHRRFLIG